MFYTNSIWFLLLLFLIPLAIWRLYWNKQETSVSFSSIKNATSIPPSWRQRLRWLPHALKIMAIACMIFAIARPQQGRKQTITNTEGIAIEMIVDRSSSMQALDFELEGRAVDRLTAIKNVAEKFVLGNDELDGRFSDLVGLLTFAGYVDSLAPPTLDHSYLTSQLQTAEIVDSPNEDGTAIGDAIGLAVEKLTNLNLKPEENNSSELNSEIKSKVIILLTDGENTAGDLDPLDAADLANTLDIKIYTVGVGTKGTAPVPVLDPFSNRRVLQMMPVNIDEETLTQVAEKTGGKYFRATSSESLEKIYEEIDILEKTEVEASHYVDYREMATETVHFGAIPVPPVALLALIFLAIATLLSKTAFRTATA
ncbi:MAG: VWA domain-containing protein [Planctomycetaceae bacterium]|nr:VWA domain-containing protein [Planctomycetaceae bacterium]